MPDRLYLHVDGHDEVWLSSDGASPQKTGVFAHGLIGVLPRLGIDLAEVSECRLLMTQANAELILALVGVGSSVVVAGLPFLSRVALADGESVLRRLTAALTPDRLAGRWLPIEGGGPIWQTCRLM